MKLKLKLIITGAILCAGTMLLSQHAVAATGISGRVCNDCHTMHNSQDGDPMVTSDISGQDAQDYLLMFACLGCHTRADDGAGPENDDTGAPAAHHTGALPPTNAGNYLAGGSFWYIEDSGFGDAYGHNVQGLATNSSDGIMPDDNPPGGDFTIDMNDKPLGCATTTNETGCHVGNAHHSNKGGKPSEAANVYWVDGTPGDPGDSYRFLSGSVKGGERGDWEFTGADEDSHNVYVTDGDWNDSTTAGSITALCAQCHGNFHGSASNVVGDGTDGNNNGIAPWIRHPTDISLESSNVDVEHRSYHTYAVLTPIGLNQTGAAGFSSGDPVTIIGSYDAASANFSYVICQSCHRAHASEELDMLRFSYSDQIVGGATISKGCLKCHSEKR